MRQLQIVVPYLDPISKCQLQLKGAMAIYMGARPFGLYNCAYMREYHFNSQFSKYSTLLSAYLW